MIHWLEYDSKRHDEILVEAALCGNKSPIYMCLRGDISCYDMLCLASDMGILSKPRASYFLYNPQYGYSRDGSDVARFNVAVHFDIKIPFQFITSHLSAGESLSIETEVSTGRQFLGIKKHFEKLIDDVPLPEYINREIATVLKEFLTKDTMYTSRWRSNILSHNSLLSRRPYRLPSQVQMDDIYFIEVALPL